jgi:hypothetical protein
MSEPSRKGDVRAVIETLERHAVEYMFIGGQAEVLMGSPRVTYDTESRTTEAHRISNDSPRHCVSSTRN